MCCCTNSYRIGFMQLHEYLSRPGSLTPEELAARAGIRNVDQIRQWRHRYADRVPSPAYALAIERATDGVVTRADLRPKDFWLIWPDLKAPKSKPKTRPRAPEAEQPEAKAEA